ncbi:MAG: phosphonate ABC transporter ATP-binding protein [Firmicutes bacterium]|nr:phosphonate ABC transporter ATP-binding protein [Bacillota bacterium]
MALLVVRGLRVRYPGAQEDALRGVDLELAPGEFVCVLGPSGAGKSTLIRCINRLVEPASGQIIWDGHDAMRLKGAHLLAYRRQIGMIFQEFHLVDRLPVLANVLMGRFGYVSPWQAAIGRYGPQEVAWARQALARVGLAGYELRRARDLSGGQRQRVAIARALVQRPRLMLGDEPVSNLDPVTARAIMALLAEINRRDGLTMLINLHSVDLARAFATRVIGLSRGQVAFDGPPSRVDRSVLEQVYGTAG